MGNFFKALTGNPQASRDLVEQVNTFRGAVDGLISRAAGNELLSEMDNVEPGKSLDESAIRRIALKYKLTPDKMNQLAMQLYDSGAIQQKQRELKAKWEEDQRDQSLIEKSKTEANPQGDPLWMIKEREKKKIETEGMPATVAPPKSRRIQQGENIIEQEWDEKTGKWVEIARGPKFSKKEPKAVASGKHIISTYISKGDDGFQKGVRVEEWSDGSLKKATGSAASSKPSAALVNAELDYKKGLAVVNQAETLFNALPQYSGVIGKGASNIERGKAWIGAAPKVKAYNDFVDGTIAPLVRSLGEKGNLSDKDIERAIKLIPKYPVTKVEAQKKWAAIKTLLSTTGKNIKDVETKVTGKGMVDFSQMSDDDLLKQLYGK